MRLIVLCISIVILYLGLTQGKPKNEDDYSFVFWMIISLLLAGVPLAMVFYYP
jgi:hypothetical protein